MQILIIGGSGTISAAVAKRALEQGHSVTLLKRTAHGAPEGAQVLCGDVRDEAGTAALLQYGETEQYIPLDSDAVYDIDTGAYTIHLRVQDGGIAFVDSPCPDHLCEGFGVLRRTGDWAACLPARASVTIVEKGGN